jgi:ABC-2 type transport system ATP-binding protein
MSDLALDVIDLVKIYPGGVKAVDGVSFQVRAGEVFALLGPNGAGKTTTIRIVATLLRATGGQVKVLGHDVATAPDAARAVIGYVPQEVALDRHLTARHHLELSARLYRVPSREVGPRVQEALALVELADRADEAVKRFSGGMKKRLDLACGLLHRPKLLILDEPTVGLDIQTRLRIWKFVADLRAQGTGVLLTTHDMEEADELADRIAVIDHGKVQALGTSAELKRGFGGEMVKVDLGRATLDAPKLEALRALPQVTSVEQRGRALLLTTPAARATAPRVADEVEKLGLPVRGLSFGPPTLGDVFLKITGHAIRDDA